MPEKEEQRRFERVNFEHSAQLHCDGHILPTTLVDISLHGALLIRPSEWQPSYHNIELHLHLGENESEHSLHILTRVRHDEPESIGLEFLSMDLDSASRLRRLLELNLADEKLLHRQFEQLTR
ncbi:PilZ domain-containing protein [Celerinatantimonas yamalensis]|uniref:Cyclic diguanosine monophosphate-binding protein n=1 Tax=Celerinatantimonas yamalensis TaxID=559956 RepID=A0ABW9G8L0_9GAMM